MKDMYIRWKTTKKVTKSKLRKYATLKARIAKLEDEADQLLPEIQRELVAYPEGIKMDYGNFYWTTRKTPIPNEEYKTLEGQLKELKATLPYDEKKSLCFKATIL